MKRWLIGIGTLSLIGMIPVVTSETVRAEIQGMTESIVEAIRQPEVKLTLGAEKKVVTTDEKGQQKVSWERLEGQVTVYPGDTLRYTIEGVNAGEAEAKNLEITQPVPAQTVYVLDSATHLQGNHPTYSIDGGQTFVEQPLVEVILPDGTVEQQPAPAEVYTHVRWSFENTLMADSDVNVAYEVTVK
jgi:uncharacterized repeat protein (TIGR01451 family)